MDMNPELEKVSLKRNNINNLKLSLSFTNLFTPYNFKMSNNQLFIYLFIN